MNWKFYTITLVSLLMAFAAFTQEFQQIYGTNTGNYFSKVIPHGSNFYTIGQGPNSRATVTRLDANGQIQWTQSLVIPSLWYDAVLTPGGELMLAGATLPGDNTSKGLLGRISANGTFAFLGAYDAPNRDVFLRIVYNASSQTCYVLGTQSETGSATDDVVLMNIAQSGTVIWKKLLHNPNVDDEFSRALLVLPGGDMLLGGHIDGNGLFFRVDNTGQTVNGATEIETATAFANETGGGSNFFVATGEFSGAVHLLKFDQDLLPQWDVNIPQLSTITGIWQEPSGFLFATGKGVFAGKPRTVVLKITDNSTTATLVWAKFLDDGESSYTDGATAWAPSGKLAYVDGRTGNSNGFGQSDAFMSVSDPDLNTCISANATVTLLPFDPVLNGPQFPQTNFYDVPPISSLTNSSVVMAAAEVCTSCEAGFTFQNIGNCGDFHFIDQSSGQGALSYSWDFGDGTPLSTDANPMHQFTVCTNYNVCLTVTAGGCSATSCQLISVIDNTPPIAVCSDAEVVLSDTCSADISPATIDGGSSDNCQISSLNISPSVLQGCGAYPVTLTVTDWCGNTASCTATVQVTDLIPPQIICPPDLTVQTNPGLCYYTGPLPMPTATDNCNPNPEIVCATAGQIISAATQFPKGDHVLSCYADDGCMVQAICNYTVTVVDNEPPVIACPPQVNVTALADANGNCAQAVLNIAPVAFDNCPMLTVNYAISGSASGAGANDASGTTFPDGVSTVTYTATDMNGNPATCSFTVTVSCVPPLTCTCRGVVYQDIDCAQAPYTDQPLLPGWSVVLCDALGNALDTTLTDTSGAYTFDGLLPGDYLVKVLLQSGWEFSVPDNGMYSVTLGAGETATRNFGACLPQFTCLPQFSFTPIGTCGNFQFTDQSMGPANLVYSWNFDDPGSGTNNTSNLQHPTHQFSKCGTFNVCMRIVGSSCDQTVCHTVVFSESVPPVISNCPPNVSLSTSPGQCVYDFPGPLPFVATDNCDPNPVLTCTWTDPFGNVLPLSFPEQFVKGAHVIQCIAGDACGNFSQPCVFVLTIFDGEPPVLSCPLSASYVGELDMMGNCSLAISGLAPTTSDNCPMLNTEYAITGATTGSGADDASGSVFLPGVSTVTYTATDMGGNVKTCSVEVEVTCSGEDDCLVWARDFGYPLLGSIGNAIAVDVQGNVYTTGYFQGVVDFDPGPGVFTLQSLAHKDVFISKLDNAGNFVWAKQLQGSFDEEGNSIAVDLAGNVVITGYFAVPMDFDPGPGIYFVPSGDAFILKLDNAGNFMWAATYDGSIGNGYSVATDAAGNVYATGIMWGNVDYDPGPGTYFIGGVVTYFTKLDPNGGFLWAKAIVGPWSYSIAVGPSGELLINGYGPCSDFDPGPNVYSIPGGSQHYLLKLDNAGNFVWAIKLGGNTTVNHGDYSVAVDANGDVYAAGFTNGTGDFDPGPGTYNLTAAGGNDAYLTKIDASGNLVWAYLLGGTGDDIGKALTVDAAGNIVVTGYFSGTVDFNPGFGTANLTATGGYDMFTAKFDPFGSFVNAKKFSGPGGEYGWGMDADASGCYYATGKFSNTADFDPNAGVVLLSSASEDVFVVKMCPCSAVPTETPLTESAFSLSAAYPNPFSQSTTIGFYLPEPAQVRLAVMDLFGREIAVLVDGKLAPGDHAVTLDAGRLPTGTYLYTLKAGSYSATRKLVLMR